MENLQKDFVTYNQAFRLKELGFDEPCLFLYNSSDDDPKPFLANPPEPMDWNSLYVENTNKHLMSAPTYSAAFRWFREKYNINIWIDSRHTSNLGERRYIQYSPIVDLPNQINLLTLGYFKTYEEAELACLEKLLEICESKTK